jgi:hypothetical protein
MAMQEIEGRAEDPPPSELSVGIKPVENRIHKKEVGITDSLLVSQGETKVGSVVFIEVQLDDRWTSAFGIFGGCD